MAQDELRSLQKVAGVTSAMGGIPWTVGNYVAHRNSSQLHQDITRTVLSRVQQMTSRRHLRQTLFVYKLSWEGSFRDWPHIPAYPDTPLIPVR